MGRVVRSLLKVPAVRRVMLRLANAEAALVQQQAQISTLTELIERLQADEASHRAQLLRDFESRLQRLGADSAMHRRAIDEIAQHMPPVRRARLEATIAEAGARVDSLTVAVDRFTAYFDESRAALDRQQAEIERLSEAALRLGGRIDQHDARTVGLSDRIESLAAEIGQLRAVVEADRGRLAEVAEHLPPPQRANLEATLHGQQLQLGALSQTAHAQQLQLGALNDLVRALASAAKPQAAEILPARPVSAQISRPPVPPYSFSDLLEGRADLREISTVFHLHVPKAGGGTVHALLRQNNFTALDFDMEARSFFGTINEDAWTKILLRSAPRKRFFLTGHYRLDARDVRSAWMPHAIITTLRDPLKRVLSHYNFTLLVPGNPYRDELLSGKMSFLEYAEWLAGQGSVGPQYSFFDDTGEGTFARSGTASVEHCLDNLRNRVSIFGFTDRFDEFCVLFGYLLRYGNIAVRAANETADLNDKDIEIKATLTPAEKKGLVRIYGDDIWFYKEAEKEYRRRIGDRRIQAVLAATLPLVRQARDTMESIVEIRDPADEMSGAFQIR